MRSSAQAMSTAGFHVRCQSTGREASDRRATDGEPLPLATMVARAGRRPIRETGSRHAPNGLPGASLRRRVRSYAPIALAVVLVILTLTPHCTVPCGATTHMWRSTATATCERIMSRCSPIWTMPTIGCSIPAARCRSASPRRLLRLLVPERFPTKLGIALMSLACIAALMSCCARSESALEMCSSPSRSRSRCRSSSGRPTIRCSATTRRRSSAYSSSCWV